MGNSAASTTILPVNFECPPCRRGQTCRAAMSHNPMAPGPFFQSAWRDARGYSGVPFPTVCKGPAARGGAAGLLPYSYEVLACA